MEEKVAIFEETGVTTTGAPSQEVQGLFVNLESDQHPDNIVDRRNHYLHINRKWFDHIVILVAPKPTKPDSNTYEVKSRKPKLVVTIHHLAESPSYGAVAVHYCLGHSTVSEKFRF